MNIFIREIRSNFRSLLIWCAFIIFFIYMGIAKFSAFAQDTSMLSMLDSMPQALMDALNMNTFNLTTIEGFFGVMFTYYALIVSVFAVLLGSDIIAKEERDKTVEFSLTLPITRARLMTFKTLAALVNCVLFILVIWGATLAMTASYDPSPGFYDFVALAIGAMFFMAVIFLAIGILLASMMKQYRRTSSVASALLLSTYIFSVVTGMNENLEFLKYFSPFKYFDISYIYRESGYDSFFLTLSLIIVVGAIGISYLTYNRRDMAI